jgi:hypothetical protein
MACHPASIHAQADETAIGAKTFGGDAGHGGTHTKFANVVAGDADHASTDALHRTGSFLTLLALAKVSAGASSPPIICPSFD